MTGLVKNFLVIAGTTCSGESSVTRALLEKFPKTRRLVTATSREPQFRDGKMEEHGKDYFFFKRPEFIELNSKGLMEEITYVKNRDTYYGTYKPYLEDLISGGYIIIVNPDLVGARYYQKNYGATTIFLRPDSIDIVRQRLIERHPGISELDLENRIKNAEEELKEADFYDYVVNNEQGKFDATLQRVIEIMREEEYSFV